ncbi:hypothetical protein BJV74DRAFT_182662 [Russula compacta]|nr:hypothetical protein BJV74DRAFT_182662 [Russula compacta]
MEVDKSDGDHALDCDIKVLHQAKLWIRRDYLRIYDYCVKRYNVVAFHDPLTTPSIILNGQPGIGKSYWIIYAVRRRLGEGLPCIWYRPKRCSLFVEEGVFETKIDNLDPTCLVPFIRTFVDSNVAPTGVPSPFYDPGANLFII